MQNLIPGPGEQLEREMDAKILLSRSIYGVIRGLERENMELIYVINSGLTQRKLKL